MLYRMRQRRGTAAEWAAKNPVLGSGEFGWASDTGDVKLGDGIRAWNSLPIILASRYMPLSGGTIDATTLNGHSSLYFAQSADLDSRTLPASTLRKLVSHWGSGTTFPVVGILQGDTFVRTDVGTNGSLWTYVGGSSGKNGWVHKGPIVCTSLVRPAITGTGAVAYDGMTIYETDTKLQRFYNGTTYVTSALARAQARATVASSAGAANAWVTLNFNVTDYDTNGFWSSGAPSRLTCPTLHAGEYLAFGHIQLGTFVSIASRIIKNGATIPYGYGLFGSSMATSDTGVKPLTLAAGDYIELQANVGTASWVTVISSDAATYLSLIRIG